MNVPLFLTAAAAMTAIVALALACEQGLQQRRWAAAAFSILSLVSASLLIVILNWWKAIEPATFAATLSLLGAS